MTRRIVINASAVVCGPADGGPVRHPTADHLGIRTGVGIAIEDGKIAMIAPDADVIDWARHVLPRAWEDIAHDCGGRIVTAGLVDSHTHAVFGKPRLDDQARRARGEDYKAIAAAGGGILSSVADFRTRDEAELVALTTNRLAHLQALGTTTVEVKSGYGLALDHELKALRVIAAAQKKLKLTLIPTFLGAHEIPAEYRGARRDEYVRLVIDVMLPAVAEQKLARFCDIFCEPGVFSAGESEAVLRRAVELGLKAKLHADELDPSGGAELAARLGATSADHLGAITTKGIDALAASDTVAVLLPGTLTFLGKPKQAPARALLDAGAVVALASDFNPGSSPTGNLPLIMALAVSQGRMQPAEAFIAATVNAAWAAGEGDKTGRIAAGQRADLTIWNCRDIRELSYWYGMPLAWRTLAGGHRCDGVSAGISSADSGAEPLSPHIS